MLGAAHNSHLPPRPPTGCAHQHTWVRLPRAQYSVTMQGGSWQMPRKLTMCGCLVAGGKERAAVKASHEEMSCCTCDSVCWVNLAHLKLASRDASASSLAWMGADKVRARCASPGLPSCPTTSTLAATWMENQSARYTCNIGRKLRRSCGEPADGMQEEAQTQRRVSVHRRAAATHWPGLAAVPAQSY